MPLSQRFMWFRSAAAFGIATTVAAHARQGAAEDLEAIFRSGTELRRQGRDAEALAEFQRAGRLHDSPRAWAQMALAEQALGLWLDAHAHLTRALAGSAEPWIQKNRAAIDQALETIESRLCQVEVWGAPIGADVLLDGRSAGRLPQVSTWMAPGTIPLQVRAPGFSETVRTLAIPEGGHVREHVDLRPLRANAPFQRLVDQPPSNPSAPEGVLKTSGVQATEDNASPIYGRWWFWALIGTGVVAAGGTTAWLVSHDETPTAGCTTRCTTW